MQHSKFGIYLNRKGRQAVRINSPFWVPSGNDWVLLTPEVNATLVRIRQLAKEKGLVDKPEEITWGEIPH